MNSNQNKFYFIQKPTALGLLFIFIFLNACDPAKRVKKYSYLLKDSRKESVKHPLEDRKEITNHSGSVSTAKIDSVILEGSE